MRGQTVITAQIDGGPARTAVFIPQQRGRRPLYCRSAGDPRRNQGTLMIPDPKDRPVVSAEEAFAALGIDRSTGYKAIRDGTFPLPVIRLGRVIRVPTAALRHLLLLDEVEDAS